MHFYRRNNPNIKPLLQYGVSENAEDFCVVQYQQDSVVTFWFDKQKGDLTAQLQEAGLFSQNIPLIRPLNYRFIWRKYVLFASHHSPKQLYKHIIDLLKQYLPLPLEQVYFDYQIKWLAQASGWQVAIFALPKIFADPLLLHSKTYLDCELHCYQRAYHFLTQQPFNNENETAYLIDDKLLQIKPSEMLFLPISEWVLHQGKYQFKQLFLMKENEFTPQNCQLFYVELSESHKNQNLFLQALGASLWNLDLSH